MINQYIIPLLFLGATQVGAQSMSSSVIALAGGFETTRTGLSVSWTLGEPVVDPVRTSNAILSQGFQQPTIALNTGYIHPEWSHGIDVFPNPISNSISITTTYPEALRYRLVSSVGTVLQEGHWQNKVELDTQAIPTGIYVLYVTENHSVVRSEILIKPN